MPRAQLLQGLRHRVLLHLSQPNQWDLRLNRGHGAKYWQEA